MLLSVSSRNATPPTAISHPPPPPPPTPHMLWLGMTLERNCSIYLLLFIMSGAVTCTRFFNFKMAAFLCCLKTQTSSCRTCFKINVWLCQCVHLIPEFPSQICATSLTAMWVGGLLLFLVWGVCLLGFSFSFCGWGVCVCGLGLMWDVCVWWNRMYLSDREFFLLMYN